MSKVDMKKELADLYRATGGAPVMLTVPALNYLMIDGTGNPNTAESYREAVEALFALSYALKFMIKKGELGIDYGVMPLEGLWWTDDMASFSMDNKDIWKWTAMIMQPKWVTARLVEQAREQTNRKKTLPALPNIRFSGFNEGLAAQCLHIGPYADEPPTISALHQFIKNKGYRLRDKHHEIYLGDPRRTAPAKLKTIIRQPIEAVA